MVGRVADAVVLSDEERRFLEGQVRQNKTPWSLSELSDGPVVRR